MVEGMERVDTIQSAAEILRMHFLNNMLRCEYIVIPAKPYPIRRRIPGGTSKPEITMYVYYI